MHTDLEVGLYIFMLATFLGPKPGSVELKRELLARSAALPTSR